MSYNKECKGCAEFKNETEEYICYFARANQYQNICPCSLCLVKTMCNTACEAYKTFEEDMQKRELIYEE